jgi:hypothetical protein
MRRIAIVATVLALAACSGNATPKAATTPTSTGTVTTPATTSVTSAIHDWYINAVKDLLTPIGNDAVDMANASNKGDLVGMRTACTSMQTHVKAAQAYAAAPDAEAQADWTAGLAQFARAATDCIAGVDADNNALILRTVNEIQTATGDLDKAMARIKQLIGS